MRTGAHHFEASLDEAPESDNRAGEDREDLETSHDGICAREVNRALRVCGGCETLAEQHGGPPANGRNERFPGAFSHPMRASKTLVQ